MVASVISQVPAGASVATYSDYAPHLTNRDRLYLLPDLNNAEYILFDTYPGTNYFPLISRDPRGEAIGRLYPEVASGAYGVVAQEDGLLLLRRGQDVAGNEGALAALGTITYDAATLPGAEGSTNVADPDVRSGEARFSPAGAPPGSPDAVRPVFGPYATLIPGRYRVEFRMKVAETAPPARSRRSTCSRLLPVESWGSRTRERSSSKLRTNTRSSRSTFGPTNCSPTWSSASHTLVQFHLALIRYTCFTRGGLSRCPLAWDFSGFSFLGYNPVHSRGGESQALAEVLVCIEGVSRPALKLQCKSRTAQGRAGWYHR